MLLITDPASYCHLAVGGVEPEVGGESREHSHVTFLCLEIDRNGLILEKTTQKMSVVFYVM